MRLFSFLRRDRSAAQEPAPRGRRAGDLPSADVVRTQARRRLIGAAVLVVIAVLVLPWVFDSKPRPLPVDIAIDVPKRDLSVALPEPPPARPGGAGAEPPASVAGVAAAPPAASMPASAPVPTPAASGAAVARGAGNPPVAASKPPVKPPEPVKAAEPRKPAEPAKTAAKAEAPKPAKPAETEKPKPAAKPVVEAARAQAMLEGRDNTPPATAPSRFVVQVGAFEQADGAREARQRVAKAGLSAHESVVQTADGKRIRVRVGPYASREEADKAAAKLRAAGLGGAVVPQ